MALNLSIATKIRTVSPWSVFHNGFPTRGGDYFTAVFAPQNLKAAIPLLQDTQLRQVSNDLLGSEAHRNHPLKQLQ